MDRDSESRGIASPAGKKAIDEVDLQESLQPCGHAVRIHDRKLQVELLKADASRRPQVHEEQIVRRGEALDVEVLAEGVMQRFPVENALVIEDAAVDIGRDSAFSGARRVREISVDDIRIGGRRRPAQY